MPLPAIDARHLEAAQGWLDLGNWQEANQELKKITPTLRAHSDILELHCKIFAAAKRWQECMIVAETLTEQQPNRPSGWLMLAAGEHGLGDTEAAYETLVGVSEQFAEQPEVPYQLALYAAMLGDWMECEDWLASALNVGGIEWKKKALADPALKEFWGRAGKP